MPASKEFERELLEEFRTANLYKFAMSLTRNRAEADDLMQETFALAIEKSEEYEPGTNMKAWLFRLQAFIDKNNKRKAFRQRVLSRDHIEDPETATVPPSQLDSIMFGEANRAIEALPVEQKAALYLVVYDGKSYEEAAEILACSAGTVKSRVSRARVTLAEMIQYEHQAGNTMKDLRR
ncbi:sigma-70 family RNA polymerase sigma factor [Agrobacterium rubi]|nr:sigma-70 family RNA polymerase sigma factor [Agrobacterium rubi]NTF24350.1 sigma-70 family RNA polymerase sigma factor [Agrobacterium rubi]